MTSSSLFARVRKTCFPLLCGFLYFFIFHETWAIDWDANGANPPDGIFDVANNWNPDQVPGVGDTTVFNLADTYTVTLDGNAASDQLNVFAGDVTLLSDSATVSQYDLITGSGQTVVLDSTLNIGSATNPIFLNGDFMQIGIFSGNGTVVLSGANSRLDMLGTGQNTIGNLGLTGMFSVTDGATANYGVNGTLNLGFSGGGSSQGIVTVDGAGTLNTGHINIAPGNTGITGMMTVSGAGSLIEQTLAGATLVVGGVGGTGTFNVENGGIFTTGAGAISVNGMGTINIQDGTFNANGALTMTAGSTLTLNGGTLSANAGLDNTADGALNLFDGTLTVTGGVFAPKPVGFSGNFSVDGPTATEMPHLVLGAGATASLGSFPSFGDLIVGNVNQGEMSISGGGTMSNGSGIIGDDPNSTGTVTIDGAGSTWNNRDFFSVGLNGDGSLSIKNGGSFSTGAFSYIARNSGSTGMLTVDGAGSTFTSGALFIGGFENGARGTGNLTVTDQGMVNAGFFLTIWNTGTVTLDGGSIVTRSFDHTDGGTFNFIAGSLTINDGITIGNDPDGVFPGSFIVNPERAIGTAATTKISDFRSLTLNGGTLKTHNLVVDGFFNFDKGTLELTGGTVTGLSSINVPTGSVFRATGAYNLPISGAAGSTITATGNLTLGDATAINGFGTAGRLSIGANAITLKDSNDVVFDSLASVTIGDGAGTPGTLDAVNGLTLDFGGNIAGFGTVDTPDNAATPLINNGNITGNSLAEPVTLTGYLKGVGTCDNCNITGTDAPGFSPAAVNRGSVSYNGTLEIELGGTTPGSSFDQLNHILGAGIADLGGTLDVQLLGGFVPSAGDTFEIINAANILDTFDTISLPPLPDDLLWFVNYSATSVNLVSTYGADFDEDGDVDSEDQGAWAAGFGSAPATHMTGDANSDTLAGGIDFLTWQRQFGMTGVAPATAATTIPEPSSLMLVITASLFFGSRRQRA